ncbi:MAG: arginine--tRNA ligase, partial [Thermoplasmata archaeon]
MKYYQEANRRLEQDKEVEKSINAMLQEFERDPNGETAKMIKKSCNIALSGMVESLKRMNVEMDTFFYESEVVERGLLEETVNILKESSVCGMENGAYYLDIGKRGVSGKNTKFFFTREDGTSLYALRDVAYHILKMKRGEVLIDVLGEDHKLESKAITICIEEMKDVLKKRIEASRRREEEFATGGSLKNSLKEKYSRLKDEEMLSLLSRSSIEPLFYSFVSLPEGKMSTRKNRVVFLDELLDEAVVRAYEEVRKRRPELSNKKMKEIAEAVGIGAVRFNIISIQAEKKMVFKWEDALNFDGFSAPFVMYSHARACSIIRTSGMTLPFYNPARLTHETEKALIKAIAAFPDTVL